MNDLHDRFRAASASAEWIFHRPPSTPAVMLRELADFAEDADLASTIATVLVKNLQGERLGTEVFVA